MPVAQRRADVVWEGNLVRGAGILTLGTGVIKEQPISWAARTERPDGKTSPEELLAAAHAACYAMAFSHTLTERGTPPERLDVTAVCSLDRVEGKMKVTTIDLEVRGRVPGMTQAQFEEAARQGEQRCPISNALRNNVRINLRAQLEG